MSLLNPSRYAIPFSITYVIKYRRGDDIVEEEVTVVARNLVEGLAKALEIAHIPLECVVKAEVKGAKDVDGRG